MRMMRMSSQHDILTDDPEIWAEKMGFIFIEQDKDGATYWRLETHEEKTARLAKKLRAILSSLSVTECGGHLKVIGYGGDNDENNKDTQNE